MNVFWIYLNWFMNTIIWPPQAKILSPVTAFSDDNQIWAWADFGFHGFISHKVNTFVSYTCYGGLLTVIFFLCSNRVLPETLTKTMQLVKQNCKSIQHQSSLGSYSFCLSKAQSPAFLIEHWNAFLRSKYNCL